MAKAGRPGRFARAIDRAVLGALMTVAAVIVERRLRKVFGKSKPAEAERTVELG
jgi:hypothetical protein